MTSSRLRLFVALDLPGAVRDALAVWTAQATAGLPGLRRVGADSLHVTLCFLGATDPGAVLGIATALVDGGWYEPERRPFMAHVTVARVRRDDAPRRPPQLGNPPAPVPFRADRVTLYRSHTGAGGARYEPLTTVTLDGVGDVPT